MAFMNRRQADSAHRKYKSASDLAPEARAERFNIITPRVTEVAMFAAIFSR